MINHRGDAGEGKLSIIIISGGTFLDKDLQCTLLRPTMSGVHPQSGDPMNDLVDQLAVQAAADQAVSHGVGVAEPTGPVPRPVPPQESLF